MARLEAEYSSSAVELNLYLMMVNCESEVEQTSSQVTSHSAGGRSVRSMRSVH